MQTVNGLNDGPLAGVKIAEFAWGLAGPIAGSQLANYGATVVKVESRARFDAIRINPPLRPKGGGPNAAVNFSYFNPNKLSVALDIRTPRGMAFARKLIEWADVVTEAFRPGVFARLGLGWDVLKEINPQIIFMSSSSLGQTGPLAQQPGLGNHLNGMAGIVHFIGHPDREPENLSTAFTDYVPGPYLAATAILGAIEYRRKTGKGQRIDMAQFETGVQGVGHAFLDYQVNGRVQTRSANRDRFAAPHNVYRCAGDDRWCAIEVTTDAQWENLLGVVGEPALRDEKFATFLGRKRHEPELDQLVEAWTSQHEPLVVQTRLQAAGVPAGVVQMPSEIFDDAQLRARGQFWPMEHPVSGMMDHIGQTSQMSLTPPRPYRPSPCYGEHSEFVARQLLGIPEEEYLSLRSEKVLDDPL
jgi:benzylsuccinate CoA-transferase BbsF subunit